MSAVPPADPLAAVPAPRLLVALPSRGRVFFGNLRDLIFPRRLDPLQLDSAPAAFWPDVFVTRSLPWNRFFQSGILHAVGGAFLIGLAHLLALQPRVVEKPTFDRSQVVYYQPSEYLPPIDTRRESAATPRKADPEFSRQPIISVPRDADNRGQTIVTPPQIQLKRDLALPNIIAWADTSRKPQLALPSAPLTPAAQLTRLAPQLDATVAPPPDAARLVHRPSAPTLQNPVAAPPSDLTASSTPAAVAGMQPALVAPPADIESAPRRSLGELNVAPSPVVAPSPQLPVAAQRSLAGGRVAPVGAPQVVPPPPWLAGESSGASYGAPGRVVALNLHPVVDAPPAPPSGNRRGTFAATADGHTGASGTPGALSGNAASSGGANSSVSKGEGGKESARKQNGDLPTGLYVGPVSAKTSPAAGNPAGNTAAKSESTAMAASVHPPRVTRSPSLHPESEAKLSAVERGVFSGRRFYSVMINTPNLNSTGGSWVIRFAERNHESGPQDPDAPAANLSEPMATRTVDPAYPMQLMRQNVSGTVIVYAVIHADGSVGDVRVLSGVDARLDRFASEAVAQWKFEPATKNGSAIDVVATFKIPFRPSKLGTSF